MTTVDISVVVCAHNEERHLPAQLDALLAQTSNRTWELIVVDNRSTDGTATVVANRANIDPRVRLVAADERPDKSYAMHVGVDAASGDLIAFCDADDVVAAGWLDAIADGLMTHDVVTGPHELDTLNPGPLAASRGRSMEQPAGSFYGIFPTIRGASWGIRRAVWSELGGMDEGYHPVEDLEFSWRCWDNGIGVVGLPGACIHYRYRSSARTLWRQGFAYGSHRPMIARLVNRSGRARVPRLAGWKSWIRLVLTVPTLLVSSRRAPWVWSAANRCGQVVGSLKYRTLML